MSDAYVHGYTDREAQRLGDQAGTLAELLHHDTHYGPGETVLEAGCGVGSQTRFLMEHSPEAQFTCLDISPESLAAAEAQAREQGWDNIRFVQGDLYEPPFEPGTYDHLFVCFVLEHLTRPLEALQDLAKLVKPGGTVTVIEGDHGSCYFHPEQPQAQRAWQCLIDCQAALGGDSLIGRRVYPLMAAAGIQEVAVSPRAVYCDASRPAWVEGFVRLTIIPMVQGVKEQALAAGMMSPGEWDRGIAQLHHTAASGGTFLYTFFKGVGRAAAA